jgi:hypothetical protein
VAFGESVPTSKRDSDAWGVVALTEDEAQQAVAIARELGDPVLLMRNSDKRFWPDRHQNAASPRARCVGCRLVGRFARTTNFTIVE